MRSDRKVIILDNIKSDCIEQAMFILKEARPENIDAVKEAERIVENYTKRYHYTLYSKMMKRKRATGAILTGILLGSVVFLGILLTVWKI